MVWRGGQLTQRVARRIILSAHRVPNQALAADGATACFSSSLVSFSSDAVRAPQLKRTVQRFVA